MLGLKVRTKLIIAFIGMTLTLSAGMGLFSFLGSSRILNKEVEKSLLTEVDHLADAYSSWIDLQLAQLQTIAAVADFSSYDKNLYAILDSEARRLGFNSMSPADLNGILHLANGRTANLSGRAYLQKVLRERVPAVSDPVFSAVAGEENLLTVLFAVPIIRDGTLEGVLIGQRKAEFLSKRLLSSNYGTGSEAFILNSAGKPIAHTDQEQVMQGVNVLELAKEDPGLLPLASVITRMTEGKRALESYSVRDEKKFLAYAPIGEYAWSAGISLPADTIMAPLESLSWNFTTLAAASVVLGIILAFALGSAFARPLGILAQSFREISQGDADLTMRIPMRRADEIGTLVDGFNGFVEKLQGMISKLQGTQGTLGAIGADLASSSHESAAAITQILANIDGVRKQTSFQAASVEKMSAAMDTVSRGIDRLDALIETQVTGSVEASASVEEMIGNIASVTSSVNMMAQRFESLMKESQDGRVKQEAVDARVKEISKQSEQLLDANAAITGIAAQTNLLAMNAAIEAAHAGDAGKGFSVVADEIRRLSETSAEQSRKIGTELTRIKAGIAEVVDVSRESETAFSSLNAGIEKTGALVKEIEGAMSEQKEGSRQILEALRDMSEASSEVKDKASEMKQETRRAMEAMKDVSEASSTIAGSMDEMSVGSREINESAQTLANLAGKTNDSIKEMEAVIGRFRT